MKRIHHYGGSLSQRVVLLSLHFHMLDGKNIKVTKKKKKRETNKMNRKVEAPCSSLKKRTLYLTLIPAFHTMNLTTIRGGNYVFHLFGDYYLNPDLCTNEGKKHI